jgi:hypothetical protein
MRVYGGMEVSTLLIAVLGGGEHNQISVILERMTEDINGHKNETKRENKEKIKRKDKRMKKKVKNGREKTSKILEKRIRINK